MSLFLDILRCIFCCPDEHCDDNDDHISITRLSSESFRVNLVCDHVPARTSPSNVGYSPPFQKSSGRTNDAYDNSTCSSPLQPTFSDTAFQSSSKPSQVSSSQSLQSSKYTTPSSNPSQIFSTPLPPPSKSTTSLPSSSLPSPSSSSFKLPSPLQPLLFSYTAVQSSSKPPQISSSLLPPSSSSFKPPSPLQPTSFSHTAVQPSSKPSQISSSQSLQSFEYTTPSSKPSQIFSTPLPPPSKSTTSSSKPSSSLLSPSSSSPKLPTPTSKPSASSSTAPKSSSTLPPSSFSTSPLRNTPPTAPPKSSVSSPSTHKSPPDSSPPYSKPPQSPPSLAPSSSNPRLSSPDPASSHKPSLASAKEHPSSSSQSPALKQFLCEVPSDATYTESKTSYVSAKAASPIYAIPEDIKDLIKKDIVPQVLKWPLSPSSYKSYFAALLHAEDYYLEKWSGFQLKNMSLELHKASIYKRSNKFRNYNQNVEEDDRKDTTFVIFEIDSVPAKRPFLLSRDLVFAKLLDKNVEPFQGLIHRVVKSTRVLVEFGDDFHSQHRPAHKYDISFSFNRVCLKRGHEAIEAASDFLFKNFLFPECISGMNILDPPAQFSAHHKLNGDDFSAVRHILSLRGSALYLLGGPLSAIRLKGGKTVLSRTGEVIREAVLAAYKTSPKNRTLICAPVNSTCDALTKSLNKVIQKSEMFRANAAFREVYEVPTHIRDLCRREGGCFTCPSLQKLLGFKIVVSTFMSSFRLHNEGMNAGHFSHIFLVDASSAPEPEVLVALANFVDSNTAVVVTGQPGDHPHRLRSDMALEYGLGRSYFERMHELYDLQTERSQTTSSEATTVETKACHRDPKFIIKFGDFDEQSNGTFASFSFD